MSDDGQLDDGIMLFQGARAFNKEAAPSFLDHVCMAAGFAPPPGSPVGEGQGAGFAWCELHCGSATSATLLAAANPLGDFHGIDARVASLEEGRALARDGDVRNLSLHAANLEQALNLSLPTFDYVVVGGVYSWVPMRERGLVLAFLRKYLKPGGAVYLTYNARPGWNRLDAFRRLYRDATRGLDAGPHQRLALARALYTKLESARAPAVVASGVTAASLTELDAVAPEILAADYANEFAEPLYVSEVASDLAAIDCTLVGGTEMPESLAVLRAHEPFKSAIETMPGQILQELAKDYLRDTRFRRDVFVRGGRRLSADNRDLMLSGLAFALERPAGEARFEGHMPFGTISFDTAPARAIVAALEEGPKPFGDLIRLGGEDPAQSLAALHALLLTAQIRPVYRPTREADESARRLQAAILARAAAPGAIAFLPAAGGTAFFVPVPDQIFACMPAGTGAEALASAAMDSLGGSQALRTGARGSIARLARAFPRSRSHYAALGIQPLV